MSNYQAHFKKEGWEILNENELVVNSKNIKEMSEIVKMASKLTPMASIDIANSFKSLSDSYKE